MLYFIVENSVFFFEKSGTHVEHLFSILKLRRAGLHIDAILISYHSLIVLLLCEKRFRLFYLKILQILRTSLILDKDKFSASNCIFLPIAFNICFGCSQRRIF